MRSPYDILGVTKTSTDAEIKQAYHRLAKKYHPDINKDDKSAADKFKEISSAYDLIKDADKRLAYETQNAGWSHQGFAGGSQSSDPFVDALRRARQYRQDDNWYEEVLRAQKASRKNKDTLIRYTVTLEEAFRGKDVEIKYSTESRKDRTVKVKIPRSIRDGAKIRYAGMGDDSIPGVPAGDLYIVVSIAPNSVFVRNNETISTSITIDFIDAILGKNVRVPTIDGAEINLRIHAGLNPGSHVKVPEMGMYNEFGRRGPMLVEVVMVQPKLTEAQYELLAKLKNS
jgi:DnaJ-class molecular chaperone